MSTSLPEPASKTWWRLGATNVDEVRHDATDYTPEASRATKAEVSDATDAPATDTAGVCMRIQLASSASSCDGMDVSACGWCCWLLPLPMLAASAAMVRRWLEGPLGKR